MERLLLEVLYAAAGAVLHAEPGACRLPTEPEAAAARFRHQVRAHRAYLDTPINAWGPDEIC